MAEVNPFLSLFESEEKAITAKETTQKENQDLNSIISKIFLFIGGQLPQKPLCLYIICYKSICYRRHRIQ